jgi:hypothetical protein
MANELVLKNGTNESVYQQVTKMLKENRKTGRDVNDRYFVDDVKYALEKDFSLEVAKNRQNDQYIPAPSPPAPRT